MAGGKLLEAAFGPAAQAVFAKTEAVRIVACGTSFHAATVAKYFIEQICRLPCWVEIASEYRYRNPVVPKNTLFVSVSQSGETADTLAALRLAKQGRLSLAARDLQRARELAGARVGARDADARGPRDRRGVDEGVHHATRGARHAGDRARQVPQRRRGTRARAGAAPARHPVADREHAGARRHDPQARRSGSPTSTTRCSSAAAPCTRSRWKAR